MRERERLQLNNFICCLSNETKAESREAERGRERGLKSKRWRRERARQTVEGEKWKHITCDCAIQLLWRPSRDATAAEDDDDVAGTDAAAGGAAVAGGGGAAAAGAGVGAADAVAPRHRSCAWGYRCSDCCAAQCSPYPY